MIAMLNCKLKLGDRGLIVDTAAHGHPAGTMDDFELNIVVDKGPGACSMKLAVKPFTLVGATTRSGLLSSPLRDRFGQHYHLDFYSHEELIHISE